MDCIIGGINWPEMDRMKYWSWPKSYKGDPKAETRNLIFSGEYLGALKRDGYWAGLYKNENGEVAILSRSRGVNGEYANHYEKIPHLHEFFNSLPCGTVLAGELYLPSHESSKNVTTLLGCLTKKAIERQKVEKLHFYIFDVWAWSGKSYEKTPAYERFNNLKEYSKVYRNQYVEWAEYYSGKELWEKLQAYLYSGKEGIVITHKDCPVYFKRTPARKTLKIKKEITENVDCFFTGRVAAPTRLYTGKEIQTWKYWQNIRTGQMMEGQLYKDYQNGAPIEPVTKSFFYGWAGSLEIGMLNKENKIIPIGFLSGLSEEIRSNFQNYKGKVIEVTCMEIMKNQDGSQGGLRHAKLIRFRPDKAIEECKYEELFE